MRPDLQIPTPGFPRRELFRLVRMLMLLVIIGMLMYQVRDLAVLRWMLNDTSDASTDAADVRSSEQVSKTGSDVEGKAQTENSQSGDKDEFVETIVTGPDDRQPLEQSEAEYQFQAVTDKAPISAEEMPAYWRLMRWSMTRSFDESWDRAHKDRYFTHLGQNPEKHRGELIAMKVSLRRVVPHDVPKNSAGAKQLYEVMGVTEESRTGLYCMLVYDMPPQIPVKPSIHEEALFVGYFLKLFSYEDAMGKTRWAPLLIGRLRWRENPARMALARQRSERTPVPWLVGGVLVVFAAITLWTRGYLQRGQLAELQPVPVDHAAIERWLETGGETSGIPFDAGANSPDDWVERVPEDEDSRSQSLSKVDAVAQNERVQPTVPD